LKWVYKCGLLWTRAKTHIKQSQIINRPKQ
jgi:hypothetical protein